MKFTNGQIVHTTRRIPTTDIPFGTRAVVIESCSGKFSERAKDAAWPRKLVDRFSWAPPQYLIQTTFGRIWCDESEIE